MEASEILARVDHTLLKPTATWAEIEKLCEEAIAYRMASVCIPPAFVKPVAQKYGDRLTICTVIGFPLGYNTPEVKAFEAKMAVEQGANEVDMVIHLGNVKDGRLDEVTEEIKLVKQAAGENTLKVIVETCYLTEQEKADVCRCVTEAGAAYIKTSTGFGTAGADLKDIALFQKYIGPGVKIKASGGIRTKEDFEAFAQAGCHRIGASAGVKAFGKE